MEKDNGFIPMNGQTLDLGERTLTLPRPANNDTKTPVKTVDIDPSDDRAQGRTVKGFLQGKTVNVDARTVDGVASTINLDRDGEVILPSAFRKDLKRFLASNAPFLAAHQHRSDDGTPTQIGWVKAGKLTASELRCTFKYSKTDIGEQWWLLASDPDGKGHAFSVGFIPRRYFTGTVTDAVAAYPELAEVFRAAGLKATDRILVYTELELLEISGCPVPSNRESLEIMAKLFESDKAQVDGEQVAERLRKLIAESIEQAIRNPQSAIRNLLSELAVEIDRQFSELKALMPDNVNPNPTDSAREPEAGVDDAADGQLRAQNEAADAFRNPTKET